MLKTNRISPEWLAGFLLETTSASWFASADGYVWDIPEWRMLTGQSQAQVEGMGWADAIHPEDRPDVVEKWRACVCTGDPYQVTYRLCMANSEYRHFNVIGLPMRRANGEIDQWFGVCFDLGTDGPRSNPPIENALHTEVTSDNLRAARALLGWTVEKLALESSVSPMSIRRMEGKGNLQKIRAHTLAKVITALEANGARFVKCGSDVLLQHVA